MARLIAAVFLLALSSAARADALPDRINFQGKLINPATNNPQPGPVSLTFKLYNVPTGGASLYTETQNGIQVTNGVFAVQIGTSAAISRELFLGASAYLGVTVVGDAGGEMVPRQQLIMSAYAFTAHQLADGSDVRLVAGAAYSTFTSAGNLALPAGIQASSGVFTNGVTAGSGTFTQTGGALYSLETSSGILMGAGTLNVNGSGGVDASGTGVAASTLTLNAAAQPSVSAVNSGSIYFDSTAKRFEISQNGGNWEILSDTRTETMWIPTVTHPQVTGASTLGSTANQARCVRFYMVEDFLVERMGFEVVGTAAGTADVGFYDDTTKALIVHTGGQSTSTSGAKTATGLNGFLRKGTMYRYCFCSSVTTATGRSTNTTNATNTLENVFLASPAEGTQTGACAAGVLPASLGTLTSASVIPVLAVIANTSGP
ncbi:MAG: hypothetical protein ACHQ51_08115 [Elusimicrobiota bacterium]